MSIIVLPSLYSPSCPDEFIGPAREMTGLLAKVVEDAKANRNAPIRVMFNGEPGIGKSALAQYLIRLLGSDKWSVKKYSGTDVDIGNVREIAADLHYRDLFGNYRIVWIEEADVIPALAQTRFLMLLDDLPQGVAVVCTSNCKLADFKKRFQTRFRVFEIDPPTPEEIQALLRKFLHKPRDIINIATLACGNVRQALLDAESALQAAA